MRFTSRKSKVLLWSVAIAMAFGVFSPAILLWAFEYRRGWGLSGLDLALGAWLLGGLAVFIPGVVWILRNQRRWKLKVVATIVGSILVGFGADRLAAGPLNTIEVVNGTGTLITEFILRPAADSAPMIFDTGQSVDTNFVPRGGAEMHFHGDLPSEFFTVIQYRSWSNPTRWFWAARLVEGRLCAGQVRFSSEGRIYMIELIDQPVTAEIAMQIGFAMPSLMPELLPILDRAFDDASGE